MKTAAQAIAQSIAQDEIVRIDYAPSTVLELISASGDSADTDGILDIWGHAGGGDEWRVEVCIPGAWTMQFPAETVADQDDCLSAAIELARNEIGSRHHVPEWACSANWLDDDRERVVVTITGHSAALARAGVRLD